MIFFISEVTGALFQEGIWTLGRSDTGIYGHVAKIQVTHNGHIPLFPLLGHIILGIAAPLFEIPNVHMRPV